MRTGRPKQPLKITDEDRDKLSMIARRPKSAQAMAMRARIVLRCGEGASNSEVARALPRDRQDPAAGRLSAARSSVVPGNRSRIFAGPVQERAAPLPAPGEDRREQNGPTM